MMQNIQDNVSGFIGFYRVLSGFIGFAICYDAKHSG